MLTLPGVSNLARPIEFNREQAVANAMKLFWKQGYGATSLSQLIKVLDISKSSFYAAFKDKRGLFAEALELFGDRTRGMLVEIKSQHTALDTIQKFFESTLFGLPQYQMRCGCMMVNTVLELSGIEQGLCDLSNAKLDEIELVFEQAFEEDLESGELRSQHSAKSIAQLVMTINQGLRVDSRKNLSQKEIDSIVNTAMDMLRIALH